jgi:hypothetical protein
VTTTISLEQGDKTKVKERGARSLRLRPHIEEAVRRATYTGDAHVIGPQGDMTATKIERCISPSGDEPGARRGMQNVTCAIRIARPPAPA